MEGFLNIRLQPWLRRLLTRGIAIIPAIIVTVISGEKGTTDLLVLSQVILSLQLSFAVFPLVMFTSDKVKMGEFVNHAMIKVLAWIVASVIGLLNAWLLVQTVSKLVPYLDRHVSHDSRPSGKSRDRSNDSPTYSCVGASHWSETYARARG